MEVQDNVVTTPCSLIATYQHVLIVDNGNSIRIMNVATFPLARQNLSNSSFPNDPVDMVATYDRLNCVYMSSFAEVLPRAHAQGVK